ncbi:MAG: alpha/beta fold hydrolase, partial [Pseudomonadota bacterium]
MARSFLMIHGIGCGGDAWDRMRPGFEHADWACEAPTLFPEKRTLSDPPPDLPNLRFEDYVDAMGTLARQMAETHGEKPAVIGHSMGGLIGQKLAERGDVAAGIFLAPAQPEGCLIIAPSMIWTFANVFRRGTRKGRDLPHKVWKTGFRWGVLNRVPPERHDAIYRTARFDSGHVYGDISDGIVIDESKIRVPTLTIGALQDRATVIK